MKARSNGEEVCPGPAPVPSARMTAREWLLLLVLAAVQLTHIVDFMIIMPLGPVYIGEMGLSPQQFGNVVAAYTVSAGLTALLAARFLDRFDRKKALLTLYAGFCVGTFLCATTADYVPLLAARTIAGAFGGLGAAVVLAIVGDAFHDSRRGTAMGVVMSAFSVASIAGVPLGLYIAEQAGWRAPFFVLAGSGLLVLALAAVALPSLRGHLHRAPDHGISTWAVLRDANHLRAFTLTAALVLSTFMLAPYLPTYLVANVGLQQADLKYVYLFGGLATIVTLTLFGRLADRFGKLPVFRILAMVTALPILAMTNLTAGLPLAVVLAVTTVFMVTSSGRMVPAMALLTASSLPAYRGSFMSLNAAVQHLASGLASALGGLILSDGEDRTLVGFWVVGLLACVATGASVVLAGRLRPAGSPDEDCSAVSAEALAGGAAHQDGLPPPDDAFLDESPGELVRGET